MYSRQRPSPKYSSTKYWLRVEVQRSDACLPSTTFSMIGGGAQIQPSRIPGERIFENVPR